ncbi:unnamed protein product [Miscanthus lutarioriparius]|uniref:Uncharacterized protein n=1 Tax=Miscanthus lutarioriparius TaxID=422564 RepID=A0A811SLA4_9POAL|nr:unnamed protein product [Miscanthus lutarioriparius]
MYACPYPSSRSRSSAPPPPASISSPRALGLLAALDLTGVPSPRVVYRRRRSTTSPTVVTGIDDLVVWLLLMEKYTMHISRSDDLLSRLSQQERRFAKRYLLTALVRLRQLPHSFMLAVLPYENNRGSDGDGFLVSALLEVAWRSWRSIWSSCCPSSCAVMVRLPGSRCPALRMTWKSKFKDDPPTAIDFFKATHIASARHVIVRMHKKLLLKWRPSLLKHHKKGK